MQQVKDGLEQEGLTGLGGEVVSDAAEFNVMTFKRRKEFRGRDIFLPKVLHRAGEDWTELDYQRHILPSISWGDIKALIPRVLYHPKLRFSRQP